MKNKLLRKNHGVGVIISLLLIISMFSTMVLAEKNEKNTIIFEDELDQSQTNIDEWIFVDSYIYLAQSFIPQLNTLTRVELLLSKDPDFPPSSPFELAIRDSLTGDNLAHNSVNPGQIPGFPSSDWIEFDFDDISVTTGNTYYIIVYTDDYEGYLWGHAVDNPYPYGMMHYSMDGGNTWGDFATLDGCFKTYGSHEEGADLTCEGSLSWNDVQGGATVEGSFTVENIGDLGTSLDWEIESYPVWGAWTFDPNGGTGLAPEDGAITVVVEVVAPEDPNMEFEGEIKIVNSENSADFCIIDASLVTPVSQQNSHPLFQSFLERFPDAFPILRQLLGL